MKTKEASSILWKVAALVLLISSQSFPLDWVCVDPGHGGIHSGTVGRVYGVLEKDVNFGVGYTAWTYFGLANYNVIMTRYEDITLYATQRADTANKANEGFGVDAFISIHHNATADTTDTLTNGTETFWCNADSTDSNWARDTTDLLAYKIYYKLRDEFHYPQRGVKLGCWDVLRLTKMASTLSEASFLSCAAVERKFYFEFEDECANEADAIWRGGVSYLMNRGIAIVRNSYSGGNGGTLITSKWDWMQDECFDTDTVTSPYYACWVGGILGEAHCLEAMTPQWMGGHQRTFHHWAHLNEIGWEMETHYEPLWKFEVNYFEADSHRYVAYFTGGYSACAVSPNGGQNWRVGEVRDLVWDVSIGADSTSLVYVYLDRNGGNDGYPEILVWAWDAKWGDRRPWTVTGPYSTHCRIKVVGEDVAGNHAEDISDYDFIISESGNNDPEVDGHIQCKYPGEDCGDCIQYGDDVTIEIEAHDPDGDSMYYEWYSCWGRFPNGQHSMTTPQNYVTYTAPTKGKDEETVPFEDYVTVYVVDVRGGQGDTTGWVELHEEEYCCICGDANKLNGVEAGDIVFLISYLFRGGPPPADPIERGDANNNCRIDAGDPVYLMNYLFSGGPPAECCWFWPSSHEQQ